MLLTLALTVSLSGTGLQPALPATASWVSSRIATAASLPAGHSLADDSLDITLYARILQSADQRVLDTVLLTTVFASRQPEIRRVASRTLSQVALRHRARALPLLRALSHDADSAVASAAVFGLGLVRDTASAPLLASTFRASGVTAVPAAWALGEIGTPAADVIATLLGEKRLGAPAKRRAVRELLIAASKIHPLHYTAIAPYLCSPDSSLRWAAAYAVARRRDPSGARALLDAPGPDAAFRAELARELTAVTVGDSLRQRAVARLRALVVDDDPHVRVNALQSIATFGAIARPMVLRGLRDRDANVRVAAAQGAAPAFDTVASIWRGAWNADTAYKIRKSLLESAASAHITLDGAAEWRASSDWRLRSAAVAAWSRSRDTARARQVALEAAHDPDARVRGTAYSLLTASDTARRDGIVQHALLAARSDPDSIVRNSVADAHAPAADPTPVSRPLDWYESAVRRVVVPSLRGHRPAAIMHTARGRIVITLDGLHAPLTVLNYATLADKHAYDKLRFHRVVPAFVAQDGDPRGDGEGGPGYAIRDELTLLPYARGAVGMALSRPDTGGSQYFLTLTPQPHLTGHYTVFGHVTSGFDAMDALTEGDAIDSVRVQW